MMIKAVFFDFYNTLVRFWPSVSDIQETACRELGLFVNKEAVRQAYIEADQFFNEQNGILPISSRSIHGRNSFFAQYEQLILKGAGLDVPLKTALQVWERVDHAPKDLALFDEVLPVLRSLEKRGMIIAVLSNIRKNMGDISEKLGLAPYLNFCITSAEVGAEKPHAPIFQAALARAQVKPEEAIHVGDQYQSDVVGAKSVGIMPVFLDRDGSYQLTSDCIKIDNLIALDAVLDDQAVV